MSFKIQQEKKPTFVLKFQNTATNMLLCILPDVPYPSPNPLLLSIALIQQRIPH